MEMKTEADAKQQDNGQDNSQDNRQDSKPDRKQRRAQAKAGKAEAKRSAGQYGKGKKKKKIVWITVLALVLLFAGYSVVSGVIAKNTPMQVTTYTAALGTVEETMSTSGNVNSEQSKTYYAPVGATIAQMPIALGDEVEAGQQLVVFDTTDLENKSAKAELDASATANSYRSSQYQSDKNQSEYNEATIGLEELKVLAEQQEQYVQGLTYHLEDEQQKQKEKLQDWLGKLNQELEIQNNKLAQQHDEETRERIQEVIQNLNISIRDTTNQISDLSMSEDMKARQRQIDTEQKKLEDMNEEISRREGKESSAEAGISDPYARQQQADNMKSAQITAGEAASELERAQTGVTAEFSGIVTGIASASAAQNASNGGGHLEGATVSEGAELFTIESNEQVMVSIEVTKYDLAKIEVGQKAELTIADKVYEGEVSKINKVAAANSQGTPVVGAEIHINNPDSSIFLGVEAKVLIHTGTAENVITVPVEIVNADKQGDFCYVVENGVVVMRRIVTGLSSDTMVEVKEGLKEGDQVVYDMTGMVTEGMNVTAVPMDAASGMLPAETEPAGTDAAAAEPADTSADETEPAETADGTVPAVSADSSASDEPTENADAAKSAAAAEGTEASAPEDSSADDAQ